ncbi:MAG: hypothetical protein NZ768_08910 [Pseudomonadales bacterium]|nr:hypothetical protein [Pseudomonadales bacterium]
MNINRALPRSLAAISVHRNTTDQIIRVEMSWDGDEIGYFEKRFERYQMNKFVRFLAQ